MRTEVSDIIKIVKEKRRMDEMQFLYDKYKIFYGKFNDHKIKEYVDFINDQHIRDQMFILYHNEYIKYKERKLKLERICTNQ